MQNEAVVIACDKSRKKMIQCCDLWHNVLGATCIIPLVLNSTKIAKREEDCNKWMTVEEVRIYFYYLLLKITNEFDISFL